MIVGTHFKKKKKQKDHDIFKEKKTLKVCDWIKKEKKEKVCSSQTEVT
jgi:hypothetical protein